MQISARDFWLKKSPNHSGDVLASRNLPRELGNFVVKKSMIHTVGHFALQNLFQFLEVEHHACSRIGLPRDSYFQHVIVSVSMRVIAFAEYATVLLRRKRRVVVEMRCRELDFACQINHEW